MKDHQGQRAQSAQEADFGSCRFFVAMIFHDGFMDDAS